MTPSNPSILLVDDDEGNLRGMEDLLCRRLPDERIGTWLPREDDGPPAEVFGARIGSETELVVTDYDLTTAVKGLFGMTIVGWCQQHRIPVGEYSRRNVSALPPEPNLFELRVPIDEIEAVDFIIDVFNGFRELRRSIMSHPDLFNSSGSLSYILATILGRPDLESQFAAYMSRPSAANAFLVQMMSRESSLDRDDEVRLFGYVLGHVLVNSILKYPGPIITGSVLCAYVAASVDSFPVIAELFEPAKYRGPFSDDRDLYWRDDVDNRIEELCETLSTEHMESFGDFNRQVVERVVEGPLTPHDCGRCAGMKGGFWCPFTNRAICERSDCSVPGSSWIPTGAQLCRIEREFFDEWSPILSL